MLIRELALKNLKSRPGKSITIILLVACLSMTLCAGGLVSSSLSNGLRSLENRLGADVIVMPSKAALKVDLDTLFLQGTIGPYYMNQKALNRIAGVDGIDRMTTQIFLSSMRASCCSVPIQVIGFDPETDFTVQPWLQQSGQKSLRTGDLLVGAKVSANVGETIKLYNISCPVAGRLAATGTGLDTAVYCTMDTIRMLMEAAGSLGGYSYISGDPAETVSAVYIKADEGVDPQTIADSINVHNWKVTAVRTRSMVTDVADSLSGVSRTITVLMAVVMILVWVILLATFVVFAADRRREFATLRVAGMSRRSLSRLVFLETLVLSAAGALIGVGLSVILVSSFSGLLAGALNLPFLMPSAGSILGWAAAALLICAAAGPLASSLSAARLSRIDTGLILREA